MKEKLIFSTLILLSLNLNAQITVYKECHFDPLFTKSEIVPSSEFSLQKYFDSTMNGILRPTSGEIIIQINISYNGTPCCAAIRNNTHNKDISKLKLQQIVNSMAAWNPAKQNGKVINSLCLIQLSFSEDKMTVVTKEILPSEIVL